MDLAEPAKKDNIRTMNHQYNEPTSAVANYSSVMMINSPVRPLSCIARTREKFHPANLTLSWAAVVLVFGTCLVATAANAQDQDKSGRDTGSSNPISLLKNKFADAMSKVQRGIPRSQKYQILNEMRHRLKATGFDEKTTEQMLELASQFRRYRFYDEACQLYEAVARNPKNKPTALMTANQALGELEFVARDNIPNGIQYLEKAIDYSQRDSTERGVLLGKLGSYFFVNDQVDQMKQVYSDFNRLPDKVKQQLPETNLKVNLYLGRFTKDHKTAEEYFSRAREIAESHPDVFPSDLVLSIFRESNRSVAWNAETRIRQLGRLLEDKKFAKEPEIRQVAVEVFLAKFLECGKDWKGFEKTAKQTLELLGNFKSTREKSTSRGLVVEVAAIAVGAAEANKREWKRQDYADHYFESTREQNRLQLYLPVGVTRTQSKKIMDAFSLGKRLLEKNRPSIPKQKDPKKKNDRN